MKRRMVGLLLLLVAVLLWESPTYGQQDESGATLSADFTVQAERLNGFEQEGDTFTLEEAEAGAFTSEVYSPGWEFIAVGVTWANELPADTLPSLEVRVSDDGAAWGAWQSLDLAGEDRPDGATLTFANLLFATGRFVQVRAALHNPSDKPLTWDGLKVTVIDGRPGPSAEELAQQSRPASAEGGPSVISRAAWGANESLRFRNGEEIWPREFYALKALFVHHTASPTTTDPAAAVRSIYYYHAVTNGWGDIGYHYVIDQYGQVYEGRYGAEQNGQVAEGGHALGYNSGTMGISMIGNYTSVSPGYTQMEALKNMLASRATRYSINPESGVWLDGAGSNPDRWFTHALMAHRDSHNPARTTCPGDALYARMDEIRRDVAARLGQNPPPPPVEVQFLSPNAEAVLDGMFAIQVSPSSNVSRVEYFLVSNGLDGASVQSFIGANDGTPWRADVDSHSLPAGHYTLRAIARTASGATASVDRGITIAPFRWANPNPLPANRRVFLPVMQVRSGSSCQALVRNTSFASNTDWLMLLGPYAARYDDARWYSAPQSLRVGLAWGENYQIYSSAWLPLTVPNGVSRATLTLKYIPETGGTPDSDEQYIQIRSASNPMGAPLARVLPDTRRHETAWQSLTYDLNAFRGQSIYLYVGAFNDGVGGADSTRLYVDNVQVTVCR